MRTDALVFAQEMVTSQYFKEWTTLAAPFSSTLIFNTARPAHHFKELLEDEAFQRPCGLLHSLAHPHPPFHSPRPVYVRLRSSRHGRVHKKQGTRISKGVCAASR